MRNLLLILTVLLCYNANTAYSQCSTTVPPTYASSCTNEYVVAVSASGPFVASTISISGGTCGATTYFDDYAAQGVTVVAGTVVNINFTKYTTTYTGLLFVYVDWNNDGSYDPVTELAGTMVTMPPATPSTIYSFTVPTTGIVTGTNLHMRVFLSETTGVTLAPCTGSYGQAYEFYLKATCPTGAVAILPSPDTICSGGSGSLTASGAGAGGTYTWSPATGLSASTGATVTVSPAVSTVYTITGTSSIGCTYTDSVHVVVVPGGGPSDTIRASDTTRFCLGDSVWLHGPAGAGYIYQWYNGSTLISGATDSAYKAIASGSYTLKITIPSGCSSLSLPIVVTVFNPIPVITFDGKTLHTGSNFATYQWYDSTAALTGATHDSLIVHTNGRYTVKVTDSNGCKGVSSIYPATLAVPSIAYNGAPITIFPNPASNVLHIESPQTVDAVVTSMEGKMITRQKNVKTLSISYLPACMYLIELFDEDGHRLLIQKFIKN